MAEKPKTLKSLLFLISFTFFLIFTASTCFSSTGVILMVKGKVTINSHDETYPAKTGLRLKPGDTIRSLGGTASILLSDGRMRSVKKRSTFTLPKEKTEGSGDRLITRLMDTIKETAHRGRGPTIKGMVRGEKEIVLINPHNSFIPLGRIMFEWGGIEEMVDLEVFLKSPSPAYRYSFKIEPGKNRALLPEDAPPLVPGAKYYWKVKGSQVIEGVTKVSKLCWFAILGSDETETLKVDMKRMDEMVDLDENIREFLKANLLISYGLYHRALRILKQDLLQFPDDEGMKETLIGLYIKMKKFDEAEKLSEN